MSALKQKIWAFSYPYAHTHTRMHTPTMHVAPSTLATVFLWEKATPLARATNSVPDKTKQFTSMLFCALSQRREITSETVKREGCPIWIRLGFVESQKKVWLDGHGLNHNEMNLIIQHPYPLLLLNNSCKGTSIVAADGIAAINWR